MLCVKEINNPAFSGKRIRRVKGLELGNTRD